MENKQEMKILNYHAIGRSMLNETIGFNCYMYKFVDVETFSDDTIFNMAKEFVEKYSDQALDFIKWHVAFVDDCKEVTYNTMFDIVERYTMSDNKNYYWSGHQGIFVPRELLNKAIEAIDGETDLKECFCELKKDKMGEYISIVMNSVEYILINNNENYILRSEGGDMYYPKDAEELLDLLYKFTSETTYNKRVFERYIKNYALVGRDILEYEVECDKFDKSSLYWVDSTDLSIETVVGIGEEFVNQNPKKAKDFAGYMLGISQEYPYIGDVVDDIIQKNILKYDKSLYFWNEKSQQLVPRKVLVNLEIALSANGISFAHKLDDGEYIEVSLSDNSICKIYALNGDFKDAKGCEYLVELNGETMNLRELDIIEKIKLK